MVDTISIYGISFTIRNLNLLGDSMKAFSRFYLIVCSLAVASAWPTLAGAQSARAICTGTGLGLQNSQPPAHYVGDRIELAVTAPNAYFSFAQASTSGNISQNLGTGNFKSWRTDRVGQARMLASIPGSNCQVDSYVFPTLTASISSITGSRVVVSPLTFNASASGGAGGTTYLWNFGDGTSKEGRTVTHTYNRTGTFQVTVIATDRYGRSSPQAAQSVTISSNPNVPGAPKNIFSEYNGCPSNNYFARYFFSWQGTGSQPSNRYEFQKKIYYSSNWGTTYKGPGRVTVQDGFMTNQVYNVRIRACVTSNSATCGPWAYDTFRVRNCGGPGGVLD